ncbi:hypothetical protein [Helicobacter felistomachi]|uniref:hypothetical protein n=1 Tax=Helicobacter felistomachi TaxID=3040201 RepID=UPI002573BEED|nr:hypothetical protein [Helicobacter sp. NHP21005]
MLSARRKQLNAETTLNDFYDKPNLIALENVLQALEFDFVHKGEGELHFKQKEELQAAQDGLKSALHANKELCDPEFKKFLKDSICLAHERITSSNFDSILKGTKELTQRVQKLNHNNIHLLEKYSGDVKYMHIHKRMAERQIFTEPVTLFKFLQKCQNTLNGIVEQRSTIVEERETFLAEIRICFSETEMGQQLTSEQEDFMIETIYQQYHQAYK